MYGLKTSDKKNGSFVWIFESGSRAAQALPQRQRLRGVCTACWDLFEPALARHFVLLLHTFFEYVLGKQAQ